MADGIKISQLPQLVETSVDDNDELAIVDVSDRTTKKITRSALVVSPLTNVDINGGTIDGTTIGATSASTGAFTTLTASTSLNVGSSTTINGVIDDDTMATASATKLSTSESIKAYVDSQVGTVDTLAEILANGNTTGANNIVVTAGQSITTDTISETTAANGVVIDGVTLKDGGATVTADVVFGDNDKAIFGAGSDLEIYSNGTSSLIKEAGAGNLYIDADNLLLRNAAGTENYLYAVTNGAVNIYYDSAAKLATTSTGIDVTGTVTADKLTVSGTGIIGSFERTDADTILELKRSGVTQGYIGSNTSGDIRFYNASAAKKLQVSSNGDISFYDSTGTSQNLFWDASVSRLGIGLTTPGGLLHVRGDTNSNGAELFLQVNNNNTTDNLGAIHFGNNITSTLSRILGGTSGANNSSYLTFSTSNVGSQAERMRIDSSGNVLVGKTTTDIATAGHKIGASGQSVTFTRTSDTPMFIRRNTSDGDLIKFYKDGTTVGSIGTASGNTYIGSGDTGIAFSAADDTVYPITTATGGIRDAAIDLGGSTYRYKDLYLSGTIQIEKGTANVAVGTSALTSNTTGVENSSYGVASMANNTTGSYNTALGRRALASNTTASNTTAVGYRAGYSNTGNNGNTFIGKDSGYYTTGGFNTFVGAINSSGNGSGELVTTGSRNTILGGYNGNQGGLDIRTSSNNIVLSDGDGNPKAWIGAGNNNDLFRVGTTSTSTSEWMHQMSYNQTSRAIIGFTNDTSAANPNGIWISYPNSTANGASDNFLYCKDSTATRAYIKNNGGIANYQANDTNLSDRREKTNFSPAKSYLNTICAIPVQTFNYIDQSEEDPGLTLGVVAQDVQAVAPELVTESNWGTKDNPKMRLSIYQTDLQYALMKCIQELSAKNAALEARITALENA